MRWSLLPSKEALFMEVMLESAESQAVVAFDALMESDDVAHGLRELGIRHLKLVLLPEPSAGYRLAIAEATRSDLGAQFYQRGPRQMIIKLTDIFQRFIERGLLRAEDPEVMALHMKSLY